MSLLDTIEHYSPMKSKGPTYSRLSRGCQAEIEYLQTEKKSSIFQSISTLFMKKNTGEYKKNLDKRSKNTIISKLEILIALTQQATPLHKPLDLDDSALQDRFSAVITAIKDATNEQADVVFYDTTLNEVSGAICNKANTQNLA